LQTFPDKFKFYYTDLEDGYKMVGNAVPVQMAKIIASALKKQIIKHENATTVTTISSDNYIQQVMRVHNKAREKVCQEQI